MRHFRELPQSKIKLIFDSPLSEGAEVAQHPLHRETIIYISCNRCIFLSSILYRKEASIYGR